MLLLQPLSIVLLLWAVRTHSLHGVAVKQLCKEEVPERLMLADYMNASGPVSIDVYMGDQLEISLEHLPGLCKWAPQTHIAQIKNERSMLIQPLSGDYTLQCESNETTWSLNVSLLVRSKRALIPKLTLISKGPGYSPWFKCVSEDCPKPTITWFDNTYRSGENNTERQVSGSDYVMSTIMCCATSKRGEACAQLYDYDMDKGWRKNEEPATINLSPGQPLLLRCKAKSPQSFLQWRKDGDHATRIPQCSPGNESIEICFDEDRHAGYKMQYLFVGSVNLNHNGSYTCSLQNKRSKTVLIKVLAEEFLDVQMGGNQTISAESAPHFCLHANVSSHPVLQHCVWEEPDKKMHYCHMPNSTWRNSPIKLCGKKQSGQYKLHLEAGTQRRTETVMLCVAGRPNINFHCGSPNPSCTATTTLPANFTVESCQYNNSYQCREVHRMRLEQNAQKDVCSSVQSPILLDNLNLQINNDTVVKLCINITVATECTDIPKDLHRCLANQPSIGMQKGQVKDSDSTVLKVGSVLLLLALVVVCALLMYFVKKKKPQYHSQLQIIQMVGPSDNEYIYINFKDFQYDKKWEFPRENLELGKELGSGAFGMVVQATAYGIDKPGVSQQVAVKMLKEKHESVEKEALMSELKMLTHIGQHANIVNLLGACTGTEPTYLIFQYCCNGDLLSYLKNKREQYNKCLTDAFTKDRFSSLYNNLRSRTNSSEMQSPAATYVPMYPSTIKEQEYTTLIDHTYEDPQVYGESVEMEEEHQTLTYSDLLSFAYQVAKGMEFLSSKNCIHRDLAARNVLVTNGRLVKIGDFGLARDIETDSNYVVRGNVRLPVKWMAPESIFQGMYTMQSDIWAYGILLWEIFSLGVTPYPGVKVDKTFYTMIERGLKMECPYYATESVYGVMCKCWKLEPSDRPPFSKLVDFMDEQLTGMEEKLYQNISDCNSDDIPYQNTPAVMDISALTKEKEDPTQSFNQYCSTHEVGKVTAKTPEPEDIKNDCKQHDSGSE